MTDVSDTAKTQLGGDLPVQGGQGPDGHRVPCLEPSGEAAGREAVRLNQGDVVIGRSEECDISLNDQTASRRHAIVQMVDDVPTVADLGSTNGTHVNESRIASPQVLADGATLRVGSHLWRLVWRSERDLAAARELAADLDKANRYVTSLLPERVNSGSVRLEWEFVPSTTLGGDIFGYHGLDDGSVVAYMVDVSGHGVGAAMHSTSIQSLLGHKALPGIDVRNPGQVLSMLNNRFQMDHHDGYCFTIWYGHYDPASRVLTYGSGGHHPGYLVSPDHQQMTPMRVRNPCLLYTSPSPRDS